MFYQYQTQIAPRQSRSMGQVQNGQTQNGQQNPLANLVGTEVKINRGGPDSVLGVLLSVQSDFIVVKAKDGVVYISTSHIKSISEVNSDRSSRSQNMTRYVTASSFPALFQQLQHQFVQINRGGPEKVEGFVVSSTQNYLLLLVNKELVRIPILHIKTVSVVGKSQNKNKGSNTSSGNKQSDKSSGSKNSKSGGKNKSTGHKSGSKSGSSTGHKSGNNSAHKSMNKSGSKSR